MFEEISKLEESVKLMDEKVRICEETNIKLNEQIQTSTQSSEQQVS